MAQTTGMTVQQAVLRLLLTKIATDRHPSIGQMNRVETLLTPADVPAYAQVLLAKVEADKFPSNDMLDRLLKLS